MTTLLSRVLLAGLAAAVMTAAPASVGAQPAPAPAPSAANKAEAKKLVQEGIKAYDQKDYDKAISLYQRAYDLTKHPLLLFNIAQAHQFAGRLDEATRYYEQYLAADPNGDQAPAARDNLEVIKRTPRPEPTPAPAPAPAPTPATTAAAPPAPPAEKVTPVSSVSLHADTPGHPGRPLRIAGIATAGVGVAFAGVAIAYGLRLERIEKQQIDERFNQGLPYDESERKKGETAERNQYITAALAGTFVVGGAVLYWMGHRQGRRETATAWVPLVSPDGAGIALTGLLP